MAPMTSRIAAIAAFALCTPAHVGTAGHPVVLLRNHNVLKGEARLQDGKWMVELADGGQVQLEGWRVIGTFPSIAAAFAWRREQLAPHDTDALFSLAFWALRHDHPAGAVSILRDLQAGRSADPRWNVLERELRREAQRSPQGPPPDRRLPRRGLSVKETTPQQREEFARVVEPVLLRHCSSVGCHGPGGDFAFRLVPPPPTAQRSAAASTHNLRTTLRQVDPRSPLQSRLLEWATRPHATDRLIPPLPPDSTDSRILRKWLAGLGPDAPRPPLRRTPAQIASTVLPQQPAPPAFSRSQPPLPPTPSRDPYDPSLFNQRNDGT